MKTHSFKFLAMLFMIPVLLTSCLKNKEEDLRKQEQDKLKKYLTDNNITVSPTQSGLYIVNEVEGTGISPAVGDYVDFDYTLIRLDGEEVVITTDSTVAKDNGLYSSVLIYGPERLIVGSNIAGLDEGLMSMKEGGEATLIMPSDLAWGTNTYSPVGSYSSVIIKVKLHRTLINPAAYESSLIQQFIADSSYTADSTSNGVYKIEILAGTGDTLDLNRLTTLRIKGSLMDGRVFYPEKIVRTVVNTNSISLFTDGLLKGLSKMKVGEKAVILVPYYQGYGSSGKYIIYQRRGKSTYSTFCRSEI